MATSGLGAVGGAVGAGASGGVLRQVALHQRDVEDRLGRLGSGRAVGGPFNADRAALVGIAQRLATQVRGLNTAMSNVVDAGSMVQIAEGSLEQTSALLERGRELALQAANGTLTGADRAAVQAEFEQVRAEIDRIASTTSFNERQLLDGSNPAVVVQAGANAGETTTVTFPTATSAALGLSGVSLETAAGAQAAIGQIDAAAAQVSGARGSLGAQLNQLESASSALGSAQLSQAAAESRIADANIAAEVTGLLGSRLRQEAATAMLAQGNVSSGAVLRLFGIAA